MELFGAQIQGRRLRQEDTWACEAFAPDEALAIIADGLGGHPAGDTASREAVAEFRRVFAQQRGGAVAPAHWVREALLAADAHLRRRQEENPDLAGMGTTLIAAYVRGDHLWGCSVGDSYLLLMRDGGLARLNELHSENGGLTSSVGFHLTRADLAEDLELREGDRLLLATDGIVPLDDDAVTRVLGEAATAEAAVLGLLAAIERCADPRQDNATAVAVFV